jgi:iron-sulfur cluster repair protein YtfE (RIC family)
MPNRTNAVALLTKDHQAVSTLFEQLEHSKNDNHKKKMVFDKIDAALLFHLTIEEEIFYPALKQPKAKNLKDEVTEAYEEHKQIKHLLEQLSSIAPTDETYDSKVKVLKEDIEHHVEEEETEMFPDAQKQLGDKRLEELGAKLAARKHALGAKSDSN